MLIDDGRVLVGGAPTDKAARLVGPDEPIRVLGPPARFVSRGGEKLAGALDRFAVDVRGRRCLDAGSSTGGFTDALLQAGAASVVAVDVGRHQLHERLRRDDRVEVREQTDIRRVTPTSVGGPVDVVVADLSFIAIRAVIATLVELLVDDGDLVVLLKPQFEAGRAEVSRGKGVIRDPDVWRRVLADNLVVMEDAGTAIMDAMVSPLRGAEGNAEFLLHARRVTPSDGPARPAAPTIDVGALADAAASTAGEAR